MPTPPNFAVAGKQKSIINVTISSKIIQLFSEGLYSSPNKAVEELVSNSFDAGATRTHVILSPDLQREDATIVVVDNGTGMAQEDFRKHWIIGSSEKRSSTAQGRKGRRPIGKFGIGKLATFVLATRLTHISKIKGKYYSTSMDFSRVPDGEDDGIAPSAGMPIPFRELSEAEARTALDPWTQGKKAGYKALQLFGAKAAKSWTVAIMSELKPMAQQLQRGRLRYVLGASMPLGNDFALYLDGERVLSNKLNAPKFGTFVIGKDVVTLPRPAPDDLTATQDATVPETDVDRFGLSHPSLGRVTGSVEVYKRPIDGEGQFERSHGFFIYVRKRLINLDDPGFGIDRNKLRHGTFSQLRIVLNIDGLDSELRSSRESIRESATFNIARAFAHAVFNFGRSKLEKAQEKERPEQRLGERLDSTPRGLTRRPLAGLVEAALKDEYRPHNVIVPGSLTPAEAAALIATVRGESAEPERLVRELELDDLGPEQGITLLDVRSGRLTINTLHPFVAHFLDEFTDNRRNLPLELLAMGEVFFEAHLHAAGVDAEAIAELLQRRDELLRHLATTAGSRNALSVAQELLDSASDKRRLELAVVAAFDSMGFHAVPIGGRNTPDGKATATLPARNKKEQRYSISLEAKSKEDSNKRVANQAVRVSTIARHRKENGCQHAIVVGPDFATTQGERAALAKELKADAENGDGTTTLMRIRDLARLVRLVPLRRIGLDQLQTLLSECRTDDEAAAWVDALQNAKPSVPPYREILEQIYEEQATQPDAAVEYGVLRVLLREKRKVDLHQDELASLCKALARLIPTWVEAGQRTVGITQRPDKILKHLSANLRQYPEDELGSYAKLAQ